jgi:hypothetical protein
MNMNPEIYASSLAPAGRSYSTADAPVRQPALSSLYEAMKYMSEAVSMTRNTADQLCGSQPESIGKDAADKSGSYFGQLEDIAANFRSQAERIIGDMQRIQNRL